ncbi:hypothetical protein sortsyn_62 [Escherichia phage sortsyn]|uniref:Uncharacterized protein n=1 Tax=Escherichia phage sortsyn TaxID=2696447 RepID=A0A6B9X2E3_9CAUD|nr:hypothetical protein sortsyn_62 [Escherichia phage sortsyn]
MWMIGLINGLGEALAAMAAANLLNTQPAHDLRALAVMFSTSSETTRHQQPQTEPEHPEPINKSQPSPLAMHLIKRDLMAHKGRQRRTVTESRAELISPDKPIQTKKPPETGKS